MIWLIALSWFALSAVLGFLWSRAKFLEPRTLGDDSEGRVEPPDAASGSFHFGAWLDTVSAESFAEYEGKGREES